MKYIVEVNAKYLVSLEAGSCLEAEHKVLELKGVWGALAYDQQTCKTDTFLGAVQGCEMVSMTELVTMVNNRMDLQQVAEVAKMGLDLAEATVADLQEQLKAAEAKVLDARRAYSDAKYEFDRADDRLGKQRN